MKIFQAIIALFFPGVALAAQCFESAGPSFATMKYTQLFWPVNLPLAQCVDVAGACDVGRSNFVGADGICHRYISLTSADYLAFLQNAASSPYSTTEMFNDGMSMGWGVAGAMIAGLSVIFVARSFFK